jgi:ethanolamine utilization protein EutP (predicted NTPase)
VLYTILVSVVSVRILRLKHGATQKQLPVSSIRLKEIFKKSFITKVSKADLVF